MVSAELQKIFIKVDKGAILWHTFVAHGRPCSWGNCQRYYNEHVKARAAAAALVAASRSSSAPDAGSTGAACPGSTRGSTPSAAAVATPSSRTGASIGVKTLQTSHQAETNARNQRAWWRQYVEAHKQASLEYAEIKKAGLQKRKGSRPDDVAKKLMRTERQYILTRLACTCVNVKRMGSCYCSMCLNLDRSHL